MSIVRISHDKEKPYVMLNREAINDPTISWAAKGLWTYLISKPDNWQVSVTHLSSIYEGDKRGNGRDGIRQLLKELKENGYVSTAETREKGQYVSLDYTVYESKQMVQCSIVSQTKPSKLNKLVPETPKPFPVDPGTETPIQTIKNDKEEIYKENDINVTDDRSLSKDESIVLFDPETFILPNGNSLSLQMRRSLSKYSEKDQHKLIANVNYFLQQVKKGVKMENAEAYLQNCIKQNYAQKETNAWQNKIFAEWYKLEHKLKGLTILKTVIKLDKFSNEPPESISYNIDPESFSEILDKFKKTED